MMSAPPSPPESKPAPGRRWLAVLAFLGMLCLAVSSAAPWFTVKREFSSSAGDVTEDLSYTLFGLDTKLDSTHPNFTSSSGHADWPELDRSGRTRALFGATAVLLSWGLLASVLFFAADAALGRGRGGRRLERLSVGLCLSALLCTLIAPLLLALALPGALNDDAPLVGPGRIGGFWGSSSQGVFRQSWGAGAGWYLALAGWLFLFPALHRPLKGRLRSPLRLRAFPPGASASAGSPSAAPAGPVPPAPASPAAAPAAAPGPLSGPTGPPPPSPPASPGPAPRGAAPAPAEDPLAQLTALKPPTAPASLPTGAVPPVPPAAPPAPSSGAPPVAPAPLPAPDAPAAPGAPPPGPVEGPKRGAGA